METRNSGHLLVIAILCLATGGFGYLLGRQAGEEFGRDKAMVHFNDARAAAMAAGFRTQVESAVADEPVGEEFAAHHASQHSATAHVGSR